MSLKVVLSYLAWQIPAVEHEDWFDIVIEQQRDVLHDVLYVHVSRSPLNQLLRAPEGPFVEETIHINSECLAWKKYYVDCSHC